ncbi:hypothetical protein EKD04_009435 [Chloroflexales bacterium ZM16-3]|nr:hypothetical protein [Chloroflexales bacterium ZM16-3]
MGADNQPRDTWGRWSARPGSRASEPNKPQSEPIFKEGTREVHLTKERTPHYQVWDGGALVAEKPAGRAWRRDQDDAIALARGVPRDTSNMAGLSTTSHAAVINSILRGGRGPTAAEAGIRLRSKAEIELGHLIAENMRAVNPAQSPDEVRQRADWLAAQHAAVGSKSLADAKAREVVAQGEREELENDAVKENETYE